MLFHCKYPEKSRVLLLEPTGISAVNNHHSFWSWNQTGTKLLFLSDKSKATLRNKFSEIKFLTIAKLSIVSSDLWTDIDATLKEIFMMITVDDLLQLHPVIEKLIPSQFSNKFRVGNTNDNLKKLLKTKFVNESDENYPKVVLHMCTQNEPAMKRNEAVLNDLTGEFYAIEANDKVPDNFTHTHNTHWHQFKILRIKRKQRQKV